MKKALFLLFAWCSLQAMAVDTVSIDLATTEEERGKIGLDQLSKEQKEAFESWLATWTNKVIQAAPTYHPALNLNQWIQGWPSYLQMNPQVTERQIQEEEKKDLATIFRNFDGERIILNNGSEWEIDPPDRFNTRFWKRDTPLKISHTLGDLSRPYALTNPQTGEVAGAKMIQGPTLTQKESPSYFRGTFQLHKMTATGEEITLINNSMWKIAPVDQQKVTSTWKLHDRIRIQESGDAMYPYVLNNLDSGSTAMAIKRR